MQFATSARRCSRCRKGSEAIFQLASRWNINERHEAAGRLEARFPRRSNPRPRNLIRTLSWLERLRAPR
jgi:hypothetical protein